MIQSQPLNADWTYDFANNGQYTAYPMRFADHFPGLSQQPEASGFADIAFYWDDPDNSLLQSIWMIQRALLETDVDRFWAWTETLLSDLTAARRNAASDAAHDSIDCARFVTAMPAIHHSQISGQIGRCYEWIWSALSPTFQLGGPRLQEVTYSYLCFPSASESLLNLYFENVPTFVAGAYYVAYKLGGLDELTASIANASWNVVSEIHARDGEQQCLFARVQMVVWAGHRDWPDGKTWACELLTQYSLSRSLVVRKQIAMAFMTPAHAFTQLAPEHWAAIVLEKHAEELVQFEKLQTLAVLIKDEKAWANYRSAVLDEIMKTRAQFANCLGPGADLSEVLEQRFSNILPLLASLAKFGEVRDFMDILGAWYRRDGAEAADANVLVVIPTLYGGASYIWPKGRLLTGDGTFATHDTMQKDVGDAIGSYMRGANGDRTPEMYRDFRFDVPSPDGSDAMERSMEKHYCFEELKKALPVGWSPRAIVVCPAGAEPLQSKLAKDAEISAPLEASFEASQPYLPIRKVSVWIGDILHGQYEVDAIRFIAGQVGWDLQITDAATKTVDDFRSYYEDPDSSVLWVISHGAHDPFDQEKSGLYLSSGHLVTRADFASFKGPSGNKRLFVMNTCSSGATQNRGGLAKIGIAQSIACRHQAVVGHLWPTGYAPALLFGAALAARLAEESQNDAVLSAMKLLRSPDLIANYISDRYRDCPDLVDRVRRAEQSSDGIVNWGSPVFLV